jgi:hypothetical protein
MPTAHTSVDPTTSLPAELPQLTRVAAYYLLAVTFYTMIWSVTRCIRITVSLFSPSSSFQVRSFVHPLLCHPPRPKSGSKEALVLCWHALHSCVGSLNGTTLLGMRARAKVEESGDTTVYAQQGGRYLSTRLSVSWLTSPSDPSLIFVRDAADVISDIILLTAPLKLLSALGDPILRRRLIAIFSTSIVTTIVSLVHAAYIITDGGPKVIIAALVEVRILLPSLTNANFFFHDYRIVAR